MKAHFDIVIVGAGIIGLSIAWQLARRSKLRIAVLEKSARIGDGSTGASSANCRFRYSLDDMVRLSRDGIDVYRNWQQTLEIDNVRARYVKDGVLWMPGANDTWAQDEHARLTSLGIATEVMDASDLKRRFPALNPCVLAPDFDTGEPHDCVEGGHNLFEVDGGYIDPTDAAQDLADACRAHGVEVRFKSQVSEVLKAGEKITGVRLANGDKMDADVVINAAGPWCQSIYDMVGLKLKLNLAPIRIQVLYLERNGDVPGHIPVTLDFQAGIYFRTQNRGQQLLVGSVLEEDEREVVAVPDQLQTYVDDEFEMLKMHALQHRLPALSLRGRPRGHCGMYTMNRDDVHPVVGPTPVDGFWVANGFSGHGFKLAPAIGSMVAQSLTGNKLDGDTSVPMSLLAFDREPIDLEVKSVIA